MEKNSKIKRIDDHPHYCIFENKICRFAKKEDGVFECKAPSDDEMPCNK